MFFVEPITMTSSREGVYSNIYLSSLPSLEFPEGRDHVCLTQAVSRHLAKGLRLCGTHGVFAA